MRLPNGSQNACMGARNRHREKRRGRQPAADDAHRDGEGFSAGACDTATPMTTVGRRARTPTLDQPPPASERHAWCRPAAVNGPASWSSGSCVRRRPQLAQGHRSAVHCACNSCRSCVTCHLTVTLECWMPVEGHAASPPRASAQAQRRLQQQWAAADRNATTVEPPHGRRSESAGHGPEAPSHSALNSERSTERHGTRTDRSASPMRAAASSLS